MSLDFLTRAFDRFRGAGDASATIPSMDGTLRPNRVLDEASVLWRGAESKSFGGLAVSQGRLVFFDGPILLSAPTTAQGKVEMLHRFESNLTALAVAADGRMAVGLENGDLMVGEGAEWSCLVPSGVSFNCITALLFNQDGNLLLANGSSRHAPTHWRRDLMEKNALGSLWLVNLNTSKAKCELDGLAYPSGIAISATRSIVVSEAWRHRLLGITAGGERQVLLDDLPGYPGVIAPGQNGGFLLSVFAPRSQLVEFVLREDDYRASMIEEVPEPYWIAPALRSGESYFEPVQGGGVRHLGIVKPWAPSRSYGLLLDLSADFGVLASFHSRANANRHGITSACSSDRVIYATCAATQELLCIVPSNAGVE